MSLDVPAQIEGLKSLKAGWLDGQGVGIDADGIDQLQHLYATYGPFGHREAYIYPSPEGGVVFEWQFAGRMPSLEIDLKDMSGYWHSLDLKTEESEDNFLDLNDPDAWAWIASQVR